jgi:hypothetical protein
MGRPTQGVRVMNMKEDDRVSAVALVVESDTPVGDGNGAAPADELPEVPEAAADGNGSQAKA